MKFQDVSMIVIQTPPKQVWKQFVQFDEWPTWCNNFRTVQREGPGWRFVYRGAQGIDLNFVLKATVFEAPSYIKFQTETALEHNATLEGWVMLENVEGDTRITLCAEGETQFDSSLSQKMADWWASLFVEYSKNLKVILQDFKAYFEGHYITPPLQPPLEERHV